MHIYIVSFICLFCFSLYGQPSVVLTFDNLPVSQTEIMDAETRTNKYIQALGDADIKTVFFAVGSYITDTAPKSLECIAKLIDAGHRVGNHSTTHPHLSAITVDEYVKDVMELENFILPLTTHRKWFRYPFLDIGMDPMPGASPEKALLGAQTLKAKGFKHAYVTIDSFDWFIDGLLLEATQQGKKVHLPDLETFYIDHLQRTIPRYIESKEKQDKGEFVTHVFLFHANDLNALCLPKVIQMLKDGGWRIALPEEAFEEPKNKLADFNSIIKNMQYRIQNPPSPDGKPKAVNLHSSETTRKEFREKVLHETSEDG